MKLGRAVCLTLVLVCQCPHLSAATLAFSGWEVGSGAETNSITGGQSVQTSVVRTGDYALQTSVPTTSNGFHTFLTFSNTTAISAFYSAATSYHRFYFRYATKPASGDEEIFTSITSAGALKFAIRIDDAGNLLAYDSTPALLDTGSTVLAADTWYMVEAQVGTGASANWEIKINDTSEISGTGNLLTTNAAGFRVGKVTNRNGNTVDFFYDDVLVSDSGYPGAGQSVRLDVDGDGNYTTWTIGAGAGADYENVDEVPPDSDTTYLVSTLSIGDASTVSLESAAAAGVTGTINCVKLFYSTKADGGTAGTVKTRLRSGTTDSDNATGSSTGGAYGTRIRYFDTDPATIAAWTVSALDSVEVGMIEAEATDASRVTAAYAMVDFTPAAAPTGRRRVILGN